MSRAVRTLAAPLVGLVLVGLLGLLTDRPSLPAAQREELAGRFAFAARDLNGDPPHGRRLRALQPGLAHIEGWISAVGAAVALTDLDGDGIDRDLCLVDPRDDSVTLAPVPGTPPRFQPFALVPSGLPFDATMAPMGCVPADVTADGRMDVVVFYWGRSPVLFLREDRPLGPGAFRPEELVEPVQIWNTATLAVFDVDGDGHLDVVIGNYFPDGARVLDPSVEEDSWMQMQDSMSRARNGGLSRVLLLRPGEGTARPRVLDVTSALPDDAARSWTLAIGGQDLTGDGRPEMYLANDFGPDHLLLNETRDGVVRFRAVRGRRDWRSPHSTVLGRGSFKGMGVGFTDLTDSPMPTILVSNITSPYALHESNFAFVPQGGPEALAGGVAPYRDRSEELGLSRSGWSWEILAADFDNTGADEIVQATGFLQGTTDRWPQLQELAMGNDALLHRPEVWPRFTLGDDLSGHEHNPFWVRAGDGRFHDLAAEIGIAAPDVSRGIAIGDVDRDRRLDMLVANQWQRSRLYRNVSPDVGAALSLRLRRPAAAGEGTIAAVGAAVSVELPDGRVRRAQLYPSNGHASGSAAELHVGLGSVDSGRALPVRVSWRDGGGHHVSELALVPGHHELLLQPEGKVAPR